MPSTFPGASDADFPRPPDASQPGGYRILIVEDDGATARAMTRLARQEGHDVVPAHSLSAALELLTTFDPQCVLLDLMLPDGSGAEVLRRIRRAGLRCRVAVLTGVPDSPAAADARALSPDACFAKPIDLNAVMAWLAEPPGR